MQNSMDEENAVNACGEENLHLPLEALSPFYTPIPYFSIATA